MNTALAPASVIVRRTRTADLRESAESERAEALGQTGGLSLKDDHGRPGGRAASGRNSGQKRRWVARASCSMNADGGNVTISSVASSFSKAVVVLEKEHAERKSVP
jgi:hypothetical protein